MAENTENTDVDNTGTPPASDPNTPPATPPADTATPPAAEPPKPEPITDEVLFSEITKRYPDKIKSREDLERLVSFNESEYIKPKSELVKKLNDWQGEPELYLKVAKLDVEKLDNRTSIIQNMMIKEGVPENIAELKFKKQFSAAFEPEKDADGDDNPNYNAEEKLLAEHELNKAAVEAKANLSQWKASSEETGFKKAAPVDEAAIAEKFEKDWVAPVKAAVGGLQKISITPTYKLADNTEIAEPFNYLTENPETKKVVADMLTSPDSAVFMQKFMERFGKGEDGKLNLSKLAESITFLIERDSVIGQAMGVGASTQLSHHLANVRPGNLADKKENGAMTPTGQKALVDVINAAYLESQKQK